MTSASFNAAFHVHLHGPEGGPIPNDFERAGEALVKNCGALFEPDGSFGWASEGGDQKVVGMLYDVRGQIRYVELQGRCQKETWRALIGAIAGTEADGSVRLANSAKDDSLPRTPNVSHAGLTVQSLTGPGGLGGLQELHRFEEAIFPPG